RTSIDISTSYGELSQPGTPTVKTSILHGEAERDQYFDHNIFGFARAAFDHNYSQGLNLQQTYGGGVGWAAIHTASQVFDLKAGATYVRQEFKTGPTEDLVGSIFAEHYHRLFKRGLVLEQNLSVLPTWSDLNNYSGLFSTVL